MTELSFSFQYFSPSPSQLSATDTQEYGNPTCRATRTMGWPTAEVVSALRAISSILCSTQLPSVSYSFKKFACRKIIICILKIIPQIKPVICFTLPLTFYAHQCCLYYDGKKTKKTQHVIPTLPE